LRHMLHTKNHHNVYTAGNLIIVKSVIGGSSYHVAANLFILPKLLC